jgi:hypothetical protein
VVTRHGKRVHVVGEFAVSWNESGQPGQPGPMGPTGPAGATGASGSSALAVLESGATIHGVFAVEGASVASSAIEAITFPIPAPQPVDSFHVVVAGNDVVPGDGCSGSAASPVAAPGFVCLYFAQASGTTSADGYGVSGTGGDPMATGNGSPYGFTLLVRGSPAFSADGTWAYTAP